MRPNLRQALRALLLSALALSSITLTASPAAADESDEAEHRHADKWVMQGGGRLVMGLGSTLGEAQRDKFITETGLRGELLFGRRHPRAIRIGPALDLRTGHFRTLEAAFGGMVLFPAATGWPIQLSVLGGYAARFRFPGTHDDGPILVTNLAFGYRPFNYLSKYGAGINLYVSGRVHLDDTQRYEITGGLELDFGIGIMTPALMIRMAAQNEDPDEPEEGEGEQ